MFHNINFKLERDETNLIDPNWYVFAGVLTGCAFTFITFSKHKWRYKTMAAIGYSLATVYLAFSTSILIMV